MLSIICTDEYFKWFGEQNLKIQALILTRIDRINFFGHFGDTKKLDKNLAELKWKNGLRVYYSITRDVENKLIVLLIGGNKNSQKKDILLAKRLISALSED